MTIKSPILSLCCYWILPVGAFISSADVAVAKYSLKEAPNPRLMRIGSVTSEGDAAMNADTARMNFGVNGSGIKIGVISDSFRNNFTEHTTQITNGDLPGVGNPNGFLTPVNILKDDFSPSSTDEGRAMLEIVHDIAPGAELFFHSAFNNTAGPAPSQTIADAIDALIAQGVDIIIDDVNVIPAPRFQDGAAAQAAEAAKAAGIAYFSSAGNSADNSTRAQFNGSPGDTVNWGSDDRLSFFHPGGGALRRIIVQWEEPYLSIGSLSPTSTDFDVDIFKEGGSFVDTANFNSSRDDPFEFFGLGAEVPTNYELALRHVSGSTDLGVQVSMFDGLNITDVDDTNSPTIFGQAAAAGSVAVAAHFSSNGVSPFGGTLNTVENFSSLGPVRILFDTNGNPIDEVRPKPMLTAPDGVSTSTSGFETFFGTSAASPHAGAVAALMLDLADDLGISLSVDELYQNLFDSAVDIETPGFDSLSGFGRIDANAALAEVSARATNTVPEPSTLLGLVSLSAAWLLNRLTR